MKVEEIDEEMEKRRRGAKIEVGSPTHHTVEGEGGGERGRGGGDRGREGQG